MPSSAESARKDLRLAGQTLTKMRPVPLQSRQGMCSPLGIGMKRRPVAGSAAFETLSLTRTGPAPDHVTLNRRVVVQSHKSGHPFHVGSNVRLRLAFPLIVRR